MAYIWQNGEWNSAEKINKYTEPRTMTATCTTAAATAAKVATFDAPWTGTIPVDGDRVRLLFTLGSSVSSPTLALGVGPYPIQTPNGANNSSNIAVSAGRDVELVFDGSVWTLPGPTTNSTYSEISEAELNDATNTSARLITGRRAALISFNGVPAGDVITAPAGFTTIPRHTGLQTSHQLGSGNVRLSYFTCPLAGSRSSISVRCGAAPSGGTPTLIRLGVWRLETNGNLTPMGTTVNDTSLLAAGSTVYTKAFSAPITFVAGQVYVWGILIVQAAGTPPTVSGMQGHDANEVALPPRINGGIFSQTDLPTANPFLAASVGTSGVGLLYARFS